MPLNRDQLRTAILDVLVSLANVKEPADQQQRLATGLADAIDSYVKAAEVRDVKVAVSPNVIASQLGVGALQ